MPYLVTPIKSDQLSKQQSRFLKESFCNDHSVEMFVRMVQKHRPRGPREEEEQTKYQPSRFSAVIGRPGSDKPGRPITALNREG